MRNTFQDIAKHNSNADQYNKPMRRRPKHDTAPCKPPGSWHCYLVLDKVKHI